MSASNRLIVSILIVTALAIAFWMLALGPKRKEADELSGQVDQLQIALSEAQSQVAEATAARHDFPDDYRQLVVLGQAVPAGEETSSLLVELNRIAAGSGVRFNSFLLNSSGEAAPAPEAAAPATPPASPAVGSTSSAVPASATVPPTEAAASLMPLGATVGPAGLATMPYNLTFSGNFFHVADFIEGIDSLVHTKGLRMAVDGRLITLDGFALNADPEGNSPGLDAAFAVTTYVTPPNQGITAGATPTAPAPSVATPASETAPSEAPATESAETVANTR